MAGTKPHVAVSLPRQLWHSQGSGVLAAPMWVGGVEVCPDGTHRKRGGTAVLQGHSCSQLRAALKLPDAPAPPPDPREVEKQLERQEGWERWEGGGEGESPMPGANPSSSRRGISNNNRPWLRPDGFDLITKQGSSESFRSLPKGRILGKQQRAIQVV